MGRTGWGGWRLVESEGRLQDAARKDGGVEILRAQGVTGVRVALAPPFAVRVGGSKPKQGERQCPQY
eukprot:1407371-Rhodomonas_salina.2